MYVSFLSHKLHTVIEYTEKSIPMHLLYPLYIYWLSFICGYSNSFLEQRIPGWLKTVKKNIFQKGVKKDVT